LINNNYNNLLKMITIIIMPLKKWSLKKKIGHTTTRKTTRK